MDGTTKTTALVLALCSIVCLAPASSADASRASRLSLTAADQLDREGRVKVRGTSPWRRSVTIEEHLGDRWRKAAVSRPNSDGRFTARFQPRGAGETVIRARTGGATSEPKRAPGRPANPPKPDSDPPPSGPTEPMADPLLTGFNNNAIVDGQLSAAQSAELLAGAGADVDRVTLSWKLLEPNPGDFRFAKYDAIYAADLARGIKPLFIFAYAPGWASGDVCPETGTCHAPPTPEHYDEAARAVRMIAARYPHAAGIEIWNEPNTPYFWRPRPDPDAYAALLEATAAAIEEVNPSLAVVGPATASGSGSLTTGKIGAADFLGALYVAGAASALDAISFHAYPGSDPSGASVVAEADRMRLVRDYFGDAPKPLWVTETGVTTSGSLAVSEAEQALRLAEIDRRLRASDVEVALFHALLEPNRDPTSSDPGYGVVTAALRQKPGYCALAQAWGGRAC